MVGAPPAPQAEKISINAGGFFDDEDEEEEMQNVQVVVPSQAPLKASLSPKTAAFSN